MATYAKIDDNDIVVNVIVADEEVIVELPDSSNYIQTSRNTMAGVHLLGKIPLRMNYAAIGYTYDRERDAFIPPKLLASHILDENTCTWIPPIPKPIKEGYFYDWDEATISWIEHLIPPEEEA